jgi:hypothetical protein
MLPARRARGQVAAKAPPKQSDLIGIDLWAGRGIVYYRTYDVLPVRTEHEALLDQWTTLAGAVEEQQVVAAGERRCEGDVHLVDRRVVAVGADERWLASVRLVDPAKVAREGVPLVGDLDRLNRRREEGGRLLEDSGLSVEGLDQPRIDR